MGLLIAHQTPVGTLGRAPLTSFTDNQFWSAMGAAVAADWPEKPARLSTGRPPPGA